MILFKQNTVCKVCLSLVIFILVSLNASAIIYYNRSDHIIDEIEPEIQMNTESFTDYSPFGIEVNPYSLKTFVINGAGYFLKSNSQFILFLQKAEMSELNGVDFDSLRSSLASAITSMELSRAIYIQLRQKVDSLPYNNAKINALITFNYDEFREKHRLNKVVFDEVKSYLEKGEIKELYDEAITQSNTILNFAYKLKATLESEVFPDVEMLWDLQQNCCRSMLYGQYAARVFFEL